MLDRLVHRGPDDEGSVQVGGAWLGHRRLSIVDVDGGHQPFESASRQLFMVGNGEVYNHDELRGTLDPSTLSTRSDNEVALELIDQRGPEALARARARRGSTAAADQGGARLLPHLCRAAWRRVPARHDRTLRDGLTAVR